MTIISSNDFLNAIAVILCLIDPPTLTWSDNNKPWATAEADCGGYSTSEIAGRAFAATSKVIEGSVAYARDGVCFEAPGYNWQLLAIVQRLRLDLLRVERRILGSGHKQFFRFSTRMDGDVSTVLTQLGEFDAKWISVAPLPLPDAVIPQLKALIP